MFQDEARFGRISDVRRCWAPKPLRPICQAMLSHEYTYAYGAVDVCTGELDSLILPHVNTGCMQLFLNEVSARHSDERLVMVIDGAGWHRSDALQAPDNIYLLRLPPYAPELNPMEHVWDELREKFLSTTASLTAWMLWRTNWRWRSTHSKQTPAGSAPSFHGHGLLSRLLLHL